MPVDLFVYQQNEEACKQDHPNIAQEHITAIRIYITKNSSGKQSEH